jgi:predicted NBD/HSP70 family sugar kinase
MLINIAEYGKNKIDIMLNNKVYKENRDHGEELVLGHLLRTDFATQPEISRETGLTTAAICKIVNRLQKKNLIYRAAQQKTKSSKGGRPSMSLRLNAESKIVIAAYVHLHGIDFAIINLALQVTPLLSIEKSSDIDVNELCDILEEKFKLFSSAERIGPDNRLVSFAVMLSGLTDATQGTVVDSSTVFTDGKEYPLRKELESRLGRPVFVESECNSALAGEIWKGAACDEDHVVYVYYDYDGVALSFCFDGSVYHGHSGHSGQTAGYFFEEEGDESCRTGIGWWMPPVNLMRRETSYLEEAGVSPAPSKFTDLINMGKDSPCDAVNKILDQRLKMLACGLVNVCNIINPTMIIFGGHLELLNSDMMDRVAVLFNESLLFRSDSPCLKIVKSKQKFTTAIFTGGASLIFSKIISRRKIKNIQNIR